MRIAILHQDLEYSERMFQEEFRGHGHAADLFDVRRTSVDELARYDLVLNRVYASVANRNSRDVETALQMLIALEGMGVASLNSHRTSVADYSKVAAVAMLQQAGVATPATLPLGDLPDRSEIGSFVGLYGYPLVMKRDMGGRGVEVRLVGDEDALERGLAHAASADAHPDYHAGYILQEFIHSITDHDCRIGVVNGHFAFAYTRTLVPTVAGEPPWYAGVSLGSKIVKHYLPEPAVIAAATAATSAIGALFSEVDICLSAAGPVIIENNPTPQYTPNGLYQLQRAVELILREAPRLGLGETRTGESQTMLGSKRS